MDFIIGVAFGAVAISIVMMLSIAKDAKDDEYELENDGE